MQKGTSREPSTQKRGRLVALYVKVSNQLLIRCPRTHRALAVHSLRVRAPQATELRRGRMGLRWNWVTFGRWIELCSHALVWSCAGLVRHGGPQQADTVAALAGLATLLLSLRMLLFALATERLCQVVLALLEIVSESRWERAANVGMYFRR